MPATFVYASIGAGLGDVLSTGGRPDLTVVFSPRVLGPLVGTRRAVVLPGRLAPLETVGCLSSTWR